MEAAAANLSNDPGWALRADLALCYRVVAHYGLTDQIYTHISARVPGAGDRFLLNRLGPSFDEMTAGDLMEVGFEAPPEEVPGDIKADKVNRAGHTIHSAIYMARPEVGCALHLHSRAGMAVAALEEGLLPLNQISMQFYDRLAYHDYEGIALAYYLEKACEIQMDALAMGRKLVIPSPEVCDHAAQQFDRSYERDGCELEWAANRRIIDRVNPGYEG